MLYAHTGGFFESSKGFEAVRGRMGTLAVQDIKGTMTLADVTKGFDLDTKTLRKHLNP